MDVIRFGWIRFNKKKSLFVSKKMTDVHSGSICWVKSVLLDTDWRTADCKLVNSAMSA